MSKVYVFSSEAWIFSNLCRKLSMFRFILTCGRAVMHNLNPTNSDKVKKKKIVSDREDYISVKHHT